MSLIEQLGGYERANNIAHNYSNDRDRVIQCSSKDIEYTGDPSEIANINLVEFSISDLRSALLKYRRQHNIFEYGDDVVYNYGLNRFGLYVIHGKVTGGKVWIRNYRNQFLNERVEYLIHATDAEIKAGRRL